MEYKGEMIDIRAIPGNSANSLAFNIVRQYFGASYLQNRLVEPSGRSAKQAVSPEKIVFLKCKLISNSRGAPVK